MEINFDSRANNLLVGSVQMLTEMYFNECYDDDTLKACSGVLSA